MGKTAKIDEVTVGKLLKLDDDLTLPGELVERMFKPEEQVKKICMILTQSSGAIKIFPVMADDDVVKLTLNIGTLSPNFLHEVASIMYKNRVDTLFNTGLCFHGEKCLYEAYFLDIADKKGLTEDLGRVSSVNNVSFEKIP